jgi:hypothetical protein
MSWLRFEASISRIRVMSITVAPTRSLADNYFSCILLIHATDLHKKCSLNTANFNISYILLFCNHTIYYKKWYASASCKVDTLWPKLTRYMQFRQWNIRTDLALLLWVTALHFVQNSTQNAYVYIYSSIKDDISNHPIGLYVQTLLKHCGLGLA